ncbi:MAG TPA: N-acetyltransferase [Acidobacteriota bacterium]|nr:N-acetyltransferase [Acidobacteriota bacterium]
MRSDDSTAIQVRQMVPEDRDAVAALVASVENFNHAEIECALELIDIYLEDEHQKDYRIVVAGDSFRNVSAYACWGPVPLTRGTYDLYWIAVHPDARRRGFGRALLSSIEDMAGDEGGRLLVAETSAKTSYETTVKFYQRLDFLEASRIRDFYDVGDDRLIFVRRLSPQGEKFNNGTNRAVDD